MQGPPVVTGLTVVFAAIAGLMGVLGVLYSPVTLGVAVPFAIAAGILWYQASGRLHARTRRTRPGQGYRRGDGFARRGGFGRRDGFDGRDATTGPRGPRFGDSRFRDGRGHANADGGTVGDGRGGPGEATPAGDGPSPREARRILGVEADASQGDLRRAYRERAKDLHPDRGGDDETFRRVTRAYERLRE